MAEDLVEKFRNMSRGEKRRIWKANKHHYPDMSFADWNKRLPKPEKEKEKSDE